MFNKNRANLERSICDDVDITYIKDEFPIESQIIGVTYLRVNPSNLIGNLIMQPEIIQSILR